MSWIMGIWRSELQSVKFNNVDISESECGTGSVTRTIVYIMKP